MTFLCRRWRFAWVILALPIKSSTSFVASVPCVFLNLSISKSFSCSRFCRASSLVLYFSSKLFVFSFVNNFLQWEKRNVWNNCEVDTFVKWNYLGLISDLLLRALCGAGANDIFCFVFVFQNHKMTLMKIFAGDFSREHFSLISFKCNFQENGI